MFRTNARYALFALSAPQLAFRYGSRFAIDSETVPPYIAFCHRSRFAIDPRAVAVAAALRLSLHAAACPTSDRSAFV
eukprot:1230799-Pleurochrysis_carterae.AAC.1